MDVDVDGWLLDEPRASVCSRLRFSVWFQARRLLVLGTKIIFLFGVDVGVDGGLFWSLNL